MLDEIRYRRSCREFTNTNIPKDLLIEIINAGVQAPSASNSQNVRFLLIIDKKEINKIADKRHKPIKQASAVIVVFVDKNLHVTNVTEWDIWEQTWTQNAAAAIQNMLLEATHLGLGSCWIAWNDKMSHTRLLNGSWKELFSLLPNKYSIQGLVMIGYPAKTDENGLPVGDKSHGGCPIKRLPVEKYML